MKFIFVFFVCCLAVALAVRTEKEDRRRAENICREELKVTDNDLQDPQKLGCYYKCVHKNEGYVLNGEINVNKATQGSMDAVLREKVQNDFQACQTTSAGDLCKASLCLEKARLN